MSLEDERCVMRFVCSKNVRCCALEAALMGRRWSRGKGGHSVWDGTHSCFCQGAGQRTVNLVCSLDFLRRHSHYCIQAEGQSGAVVQPLQCDFCRLLLAQRLFMFSCSSTVVLKSTPPPTPPLSLSFSQQWPKRPTRARCPCFVPQAAASMATREPTACAPCAIRNT